MNDILSIANSYIDLIGENISLITIIVFAILIGIEVIIKVPSLLHTPLMSGTNAISGVTIVGGIYLVRTATTDDLTTIVIGSLAIFAGAINVVGGFLVTNRMLEKFKK